MDLRITFNGEEYTLTYNKQTGYYEIELQAPSTGGVYNADIEFTDLFGGEYEATKPIQVFVKEPIKIDTKKIFMWIFSYSDFKIKDIVELQEYELQIDEETNANTIIRVLKETSAKAKDIIVIKENNEVIYWGKIENIQNENGKLLYEFITRYITNIFDQTIELKNENLIRQAGIEDFIANAITTNFISNTDTFVNKDYLELRVLTHTPKDVSVSNVENGIYNLHTWLTNCNQLYDIAYEFSVENNKLIMTIENKQYSKRLIDTKAMNISDYSEVFETDVVSKVVVLTSTNPYTLYLLNDRTTTTDGTNPNRADGSTKTVYTENYSDAPQKALDEMKANSYEHNITFKLDKYIRQGTPIAIKTKNSLIYDTYISKVVRQSNNKFYEYTCGNIRINFIDKIKQNWR